MIVEPWVWAIVAVIGIILEVSTLDFIAIWITPGALVAMFISFFQGTSTSQWWFTSQILSLIAVSFVLLIFVKPIAYKALFGKKVKTNLDLVMGQRKILLKDISFNNPGEIRMNGSLWRVVTRNEKDEISAGATVEILETVGNKLVVKEVEERETPQPKIEEIDIREKKPKKTNQKKETSGIIEDKVKEEK